MPLKYDGDIAVDFFKVLSNKHVPTMMYFFARYGNGMTQVNSIIGFGENSPRGPLHIKIKAIIDELGVFEFCRIAQILWAAQLKSDGLPLVGALDFTYEDHYQQFLPPRPTSN